MSEEKVAILLRRFAVSAQAHQEALEEMEEERANRHAGIISQLRAAILREEDAGLQGLLGLLEHQSPVVAGMAAVCLLETCPDRALTVLRLLAGQGGMLGFRASVAIERWENGEWHSP